MQKPDGSLGAGSALAKRQEPGKTLCDVREALEKHSQRLRCELDELRCLILSLIAPDGCTQIKPAAARLAAVDQAQGRERRSTEWLMWLFNLGYMAEPQAGLTSQYVRASYDEAFDRCAALAKPAARRPRMLTLTLPWADAKRLHVLAGGILGEDEHAKRAWQLLGDALRRGPVAHSSPDLSTLIEALQDENNEVVFDKVAGLAAVGMTP